MSSMTRGKRLAPITQCERVALLAMGELIYHCNSVDRWATQREGQPYWFADLALRAALTDLYGEDDADEIRDIHSDCGESIVHCIESFYGQKLEVIESE